MNFRHFLARLLLVFLLVSPMTAHAGVHISAATLGVDAGLRSDELDWNIAGSLGGTNPNILSELRWENLQISQLRLGGSFDLQLGEQTRVRPTLLGRVGVGRILSGDNRDSDYDGDNRTQEFSRSINDAGDGDVFDFSVGVGQKFPVFSQRVTLLPLGGYSYHRQQLTMSSGKQVIPAEGPFPGLDSRYTSEWWGGWLGLSVQVELPHGFRVQSLTEHHWVDYYAEANWNLRPEFAHPLSFAQHATGRGWVQEVTGEYPWRPHWIITAAAMIQRWETAAGYDHVFLVSGDDQYARLNRVRWQSVSFQFGMRYLF